MTDHPQEPSLRAEDVESALLRAAARARRVAAETGTPLVTVRDGEVVETGVTLGGSASTLRNAG